MVNKKNNTTPRQSREPMGFRERGVNIILSNPLNPDVSTELFGRRQVGYSGYLHDIFRTVFLLTYYYIVFVLFVMVNFFSNGIIISSFDMIFRTNLTYYFPYITISPFTWLGTWWKTGNARFYEWGWEQDEFVFFKPHTSVDTIVDGKDNVDTGVKTDKMPPVSSQIINLVQVLVVIVVVIYFLKKISPDVVKWAIEQYEQIRKWYYGDKFNDLDPKEEHNEEIKKVAGMTPGEVVDETDALIGEIKEARGRIQAQVEILNNLGKNAIDNVNNGAMELENNTKESSVSIDKEVKAEADATESRVKGGFHKGKSGIEAARKKTVQKIGGEIEQMSKDNLNIVTADKALEKMWLDKKLGESKENNENKEEIVLEVYKKQKDKYEKVRKRLDKLNSDSRKKSENTTTAIKKIKKFLGRGKKKELDKSDGGEDKTPGSRKRKRQEAEVDDARTRFNNKKMKWATFEDFRDVYNIVEEDTKKTIEDGKELQTFASDFEEELESVGTEEENNNRMEYLSTKRRLDNLEKQEEINKDIIDLFRKYTSPGKYQKTGHLRE